MYMNYVCARMQEKKDRTGGTDTTADASDDSLPWDEKDACPKDKERFRKHRVDCRRPSYLYLSEFESDADADQEQEEEHSGGVSYNFGHSRMKSRSHVSHRWRNVNPRRKRDEKKRTKRHKDASLLRLYTE